MLSGATLDLLSKSPGASAGEHLPSSAPDSHLHSPAPAPGAGVHVICLANHASVGRGQSSLTPSRRLSGRVTCLKGKTYGMGA